MTEEEKMRKEDEKLDKELIEVLTQISIVAGRMARNISLYSGKHPGKVSDIMRKRNIILFPGRKN